MKSLFENVNDELEKIFQWFKGNKLPLNEGKTKFFLFHKPRYKDNFPLPLPNLKNNNYKLKRFPSIFVILVDEKIVWVDHITTVQNKPS